MIDWPLIDDLVERSRWPLNDTWLEGLQEQYGERHNYYRFLYHLLLARRPKVALEIGTYFGIGSAYMAAAAASYGGVVIGLDLNGHELTNKLIQERYGNYHFIQGDSTKIETYGQVWDLVSLLGPIGVVYQDSSHHYRASCHEWELYTRFLDQGAVWVCDDITPAFHDPNIDPPGLGMVQYFEGLPGQKKLYKDVLHFGNTQGVILV